MGAEPIRRVVIAGGGTAGWMAASALAFYFGRTLEITLVESEEIGIVGVGEATIPQIQLFNSAIGIDEADFLKATGGTFKLGIEFDGWGEEGESYFHGFGQVGRAPGMVPFYQYWLRYHAEGGTLALDDFAPNVIAARAGQFGRAGDDKAAPAFAYAYHFDAALYAGFLREQAEARGVQRVEGKIAAVRQNAENGHVRALLLAGGQDIAGDLFIDCTGFRGLLIGETMGAGYEDWSHYLPANRAWAVPTANVGPPDPFTRSTAREAGWQWHIPLQHRTGNGHVFSSAWTSEEAARDLLLANLRGPALAEPRMLRFTTGRRADPFTGNVVAIGLASGFLEPLESTSIHMIQSAISRLVAMFPNSGFDPAARAEYNAQTRFEYESVRDFIVAHYRVNRRTGTFWEHCRTMPIPDSLAHKLALFSEAGRIVRFNTELFDVPSWLQVLWGQGLRPAGWHPMVDAVSAADLAGFIDRSRRAALGQVQGLATHADYLAAHCPAPAAPAPVS